MLLKRHRKAITCRLHLTGRWNFQTALVLRRPRPPSGGPRRHETQQRTQRQRPTRHLRPLTALRSALHFSLPPCPALPSSAFFFFWLKKGSLLARFTDSLLFFVVVVACVCFSVSLVQLSQKSDGGEKETDKQSLALVPTTVHRNRSSNFCLSCVQPVQLWSWCIWSYCISLATLPLFRSRFRFTLLCSVLKPKMTSVSFTGQLCSVHFV